MFMFRKIKKEICSILLMSICVMSVGVTDKAFAIQDVGKTKNATHTNSKSTTEQSTLKYSKTAKNVNIAFVLDGPSDKNKEIITTFKTTIQKSLAPDFKVKYNDKMIFIGDWTKKGAQIASDKALQLPNTIVVSLGYLSSVYLSSVQNKGKFVVTIDQYGLRGVGKDFFNPVQQSINDLVLFRKLIEEQYNTAILVNQNFYDMEKDWQAIVTQKFKEKGLNFNFSIIPVSTNIQKAIAAIPQSTDSVLVTPMFNLSVEQRRELFTELNKKKLPTFSTVGKEDVQLGAMLGTGTMDVDRKLAEATSFNIYSVLKGEKVKPERIPFYEERVIYINIDTAEEIGYDPHLRLLNNAEVITNKKSTVHNLSYIFNTLEESNLDIKRKQFLVSAARRSTASAYLRYLPTLRMDLGYQSYNNDYAMSYSNVPLHVGQFVIGMDQVIYSPDLVTNILVKHKRLKFDKAEQVLTEQNMGLEIAFLYLDCLMLENAIKVQEEFVKETRENLAIARVREKAGYSGKEEALRWAGKLSECERTLLTLRASYKNTQIKINKLLNKDQSERFTLEMLKASDPAFFSSDINIIDYIRRRSRLEKFTDMLVEEAQYLSPETAKLKAAIAMKKIEIANYGQKFIMPNAKISLEYGTQFDRNLPYEMAGHLQLASAGGLGTPWLNLNKTSGRVFIGAQWKPIEGGHKIAEIARCKSELNELNAYLEEVNTQIEQEVREVVNRAIAKYFIIEKSYRARFAEGENYQLVKHNYLIGKSPINQVADAQDLYFKAKLESVNAQYEFFKELVWVQRALISINWTKARPEAKDFLKKVKEALPREDDFSL